VVIKSQSNSSLYNQSLSGLVSALSELKNIFAYSIKKAEGKVGRRATGTTLVIVNDPCIDFSSWFSKLELPNNIVAHQRGP
jgi:hypothetical protein